MIDDWADLLLALLDAHARFLIVGAHALSVHGVPRATQDLEVWLDPTPDNAARVWAALAAFGAPLDDLGVTVSDLTDAETVVQVGLPPNRVDLLSSISGVSSFDEAWNARITQGVRGRDVPFLGREALIANKRATGRLKDQADLQALRELKS
jgi:hypothetical protein